MRRKLLGLMSAGALIAGASVLVAAGPASGGEPGQGPSVEVNIKKVVHGDDPGVAFPIVLTCTSVTEPRDFSAQDDINLDQNDTDTFTVHLKNGESDTVTVQLPPEEPDLVTCEVTEDVSDADLPTGWECTPDIDPAELTLYERNPEIEQELSDEFDVTVENDCTKPVTTTTTTTTTAPVSPPPPPPVKPIVAVARFTG